MTDETPVSAWPATVLRPADLPTVDRGGEVTTTPLVTADRGATSFLNGITDFAPGARIAHHRHNCVESVVILAGAAVVDIAGVRTALCARDTTFVPGGIPHHFENASAIEPMSILWTYASVDATRHVEETGQTRRVDAEAGRDAAHRPVHETARLFIVPGREAAFEAAVTRAIPAFRRATGCRSFTLRRVVEAPSTYVLTILWDDIADHLDTFRTSDGYRLWRREVGDFFAAPPAVEHDILALKGF